MTIRDIAKLSGCAVSTVSRALNDHPDVSPQTKEKIKRIVEENRFVPNTNAKHLKQQVSNTIIVVVKGSFNLFFAAIVEKIQAGISQAGYGLIIHYLDENDNEVRVAEQLCRENKPRGVLFLGGEPRHFIKRFSAINVPCVLATTSAEELPFENLSSVAVDDQDGGYRAIQYLVEMGHRKIGIISGCVDASAVSALRMEGCKAALRASGIPYRKQYCRYVAFSPKEGYLAAQDLLRENPELTAIFAMSDMTAFGAIRAIREKGLRVPEDISVVGYDGIEMAEYFQPALTTLKQPAEAIADQSVRMLLDAVERTVTSRHLRLETSLVQGRSVLQRPSSD